MPSLFDVLGQDHKEVKRMLAELEKGPIAATGASDSHLILRKKMVEELVIEESRHEAVEEMYFWSAVRDRLPNGDELADTATEPGTDKARKSSATGWTKLNVDQPRPTHTRIRRRHRRFSRGPGPRWGRPTGSGTRPPGRD